MEKHGDRRVRMVPAGTGTSEEKVNEELEEHMALLEDAVDSPLVQLIMRNSMLTLLELPEHFFSLERVYALISQAQFRAGVIKKLREATPAYWSEEWDSAWTKDVEPLLSRVQQSIARRNRLIVFWSKEWDNIPNDVKLHVANIVGKRMK